MLNSILLTPRVPIWCTQSVTIFVPGGYMYMTYSVCHLFLSLRGPYKVLSMSQFLPLGAIWHTWYFNHFSLSGAYMTYSVCHSFLAYGGLYGILRMSFIFIPQGPNDVLGNIKILWDFYSNSGCTRKQLLSAPEIHRRFVNRLLIFHCCEVIWIYQQCQP